MKRTSQCAMSVTLLKAGQVAGQAGVTVQALRHYDRLGLLDRVARTEGNHRIYCASTCSDNRLLAWLDASLHEGWCMHESKDTWQKPVRVRAARRISVSQGGLR